ncbi:mechanosensitive ion channel [soil metagenome]
MDNVIYFLNYPLMEIGASTVTPKLIGLVLVSMLTLVIVTKWLERWGARVLARRNAELGASRALFQIFRYAALVIGMVVIVQSVGIDLSAFVVVVGTLGIGIGLALQPLLANFVGGLVLLVERPLKVGDRIEIDGTAGLVVHIGARATNVRTNSNINVIVPNSLLTQTKIINWSHSERNIRVEVPIGVSYKADPLEVERVLLDVARSHAGVLDAPVSDVMLDRFDDSAVVFILRVWTEAFLDRPNVLRSELNFAISAALRTNAIEIPFPQRDIHIRSGQLAQ